MSKFQSNFNIRAFVLKSIKFKDSDRIYTLYSLERGKIAVIGKGVRKITSRRGAHMDTMNLIETKITQHVSGQLYLEEAKVAESYINIKHDYHLSVLGFYIAELINLSTHDEDVSESIFLLIQKIMRILDKGEENPGIAINKFEIKLMQLLGYEPPKYLLSAWRTDVIAGNVASADQKIKKFIFEMLGKEVKSLQLI